MILARFKTFETTFFRKDGSKREISKEELEKMIASGEAKKISLREAFPGSIKSPYIGLVIKLNNGLTGVIIDIFERNGDYIFDLFTRNGEVEKNLSWNRDYKIAFGDKVNGFYPFGEDHVPNKRHTLEILPIIQKAEDDLGISLGVAKKENLN